jgi:hypothetical protein
VVEFPCQTEHIHHCWLPDDPLTGKPFRYELAGDTAHLRGQPPAGEEKDPDFNLHYEVTLRK